MRIVRESFGSSVENHAAYYLNGRFMNGCPQKATCYPCQREWAKMIDINQVYQDLKSAVIGEIRVFRTFAEKHSRGIQLFRRVCDEINANYANYENDRNVRQLIGTKILISGTILEMIRDPYYPVM